MPRTAIIIPGAYVAADRRFAVSYFERLIGFPKYD
jgi:hypothetical protein